MLESLFLAVTLIIPKAGVQIASVPLTLNLVLFALLIVKNVQRTFVSIQISSWVGAFYYGFLMLGIISTLLVIGGRSTFQLAQNVVVLFSPLAIVATRGMDRDRAMKIVVVSLIIVNVVGLLQYAFGITRMSIQGITYTWGQSLTTKPIGYGYSSVGEADKIVSTFQNGNTYGICLALFLPIVLLWQCASSKWKKLRVVSIALGLIGLAICGSRSVVLPFLFAGIYLLFQRFSSWEGNAWKQNFLLVFVFIIIVIVYIIYSNSAIFSSFFNRIIRQTINDPTATGRTDLWSNVITTFFQMNPLEQVHFVLLGQNQPYDLVSEGFPEFVSRFGLIGALLFYGTLAATILYFWSSKASRAIGAGMACTLFAFLVDQSYYYPPTVMQFFLAAGIGCGLLAGNYVPHGKKNASRVTVQRHARWAIGDFGRNSR